MNGLRRNDVDAIDEAGNNLLPLVAIVILNWNGKKFLEQFLPSVFASTYLNKQVVIADNASTDDSVLFLQQHYPTVTLIRNNSNEGFAKGYNTALEQVKADYYVLLNSDVEVTPGWIEPIVTLMQADKMIAACQPKLLAFHNKTQFEYAGACGGWIDRFGYPFTRGRIFDFCETDHGQYDDATACFWASGAALFVRPELFHAMEGFDEYFFAHQEEIDLCWRLQRAGYKIFVQPASVVYHVGGGTLPKGNSLKTYLNFRNNLLMLYKNLPLKQACWIIPSRIMLDAMAAWKSLLQGDPGFFMAVFKAHLHFFKRISSAKSKAPIIPLPTGNFAGMFKGSIVWAHFIKKKNTFLEIIKPK